MVEWSEDERTIINNIFATLDYEDVGPKALSRYMWGWLASVENLGRRVQDVSLNLVVFNFSYHL